MNFAMWSKALRIIPRISKEEWQRLDVISKWLISTRAAVLIMTFLSGAIAGILATKDGKFSFWLWLLLEIGIVMAHATNNLFNDYTDFVKGVDENNYYRAQYGPQPLVHGLMTRRQNLLYAAVTGLVALAAGVGIIVIRWLVSNQFPWLILIILAAGAFFVLAYTWPLKYIALGEISVLLVWGPLMIGGGYYVITGDWSWNAVIASLPYALGVTTVIFGKHVDKYLSDRQLGIHTLPVVIGEKAGRVSVVAMFILQYLSVFYLVAVGYFSPFVLVVVFALFEFFRILPMFRMPRPEEKPADFPDVWPNYFVAAAFVHNRRFGMLYLLGLILETLWVLLVRPLVFDA